MMTELFTSLSRISPRFHLLTQKVILAQFLDTSHYFCFLWTPACFFHLFYLLAVGINNAWSLLIHCLWGDFFCWQVSTSCIQSRFTASLTLPSYILVLSGEDEWIFHKTKGEDNTNCISNKNKLEKQCSGKQAEFEEDLLQKDSVFKGKK